MTSTTFRIALVLASLAAWPQALRAEPESTPPSILLVVVDDLRFDALGFAGNKIVSTPNIDKLARDGTVFDNSFCTTSICATSRASILTGQYARRHRIQNFRTQLSDAAFSQTFPALLRRAGYFCGFIGKWGIGGQLPRSRYDIFEGFPGQGRYFQKGRKLHLTRVLESQAVSFIEKVPKDRPFCLQVSFKAAHCQDGDPWPFQPDSKYSELYESTRIPPPETARAAEFEKLPAFLRDSEARVRWRLRFANEALYQKSVRDYYRLITGVDDAMGKIRGKLQERGLAKNTVVIFTADNGFYLGDRGLAGKWFMHEESIRVPLVVFDPRTTATRRGARVEEMALLIDLAPTIVELAGAAPPRSMQGTSLVPLLRGQSVEWRQDWFYEHLFEHRRIPKSEGVRSSRWKYVNYIEVPAAKSPSGLPIGSSFEQLYDLESDPLERRDLSRAPEHRDDLERLRKRWTELRESVR